MFYWYRTKLMNVPGWVDPSVAVQKKGRSVTLFDVKKK
jgi:hypothetical protein